MAWLYLLAAIAFEVSGTTMMKLSNGFEKAAPSILMIAFYTLSFTALTMALKRIDVSVAYAIWSGVGTVVVAAIGLWFFREPLTALKAVGLLMVAGGVAAVHLGSGAPAE